MESTILRYEVLQQMDTGDPFDLVFITADRRRGTGGVIKRVNNWVKIKSDTPQELLPGRLRLNVGQPSRNPEHGRHKTFNICNPRNPGDHPVKVHWRLMIFFNGKRILE